MKGLVQRISSHPNYAKTLEWGKLITITGSTQVLIQALGFLSGIMIIRLLSTQEYALYTLANTFLGTMVMLADSGISSGVMAEGGKVWQNKKKLGIVLATGLHLRRKFGLISLIVTAPILIYLLTEHGASWFTASLIILSIVPAFFASLSDSFLEMAPKLHQDIKPLQKNQAEVSVGRLVLSILFLFFFPFTFIALIANSIPRVYGNYQLRKTWSRYVSIHEKPDPLVQKEVVRGVKRTLPIVIYHCISGQISIWLVSFFGTTTNISEIGAMGRISIVFTLFATLFSTLIVPRFSRMEAVRSSLLKSFLLVQIVSLIISVALLISIWAFSNQILWILGENYLGLNYELLLMGLSACFALMGGICSQMVVNRGWFLRPYFLIGANIFSLVFSITFFNLSSVVGILYFNIMISAVAYFIVLLYGFISINRTT